MKRIFLSYRRDDSADMTGRIFDHLERRFGRDSVFIDVDSIPLGDDFRNRIEDTLDRSGVLLAIIGDRWLGSRPDDRGGTVRRIDDPGDYVAMEVTAALERGITVIPVLVGDASMPTGDELPHDLAALALRNAAVVRSGRDFRDDVRRLVEAVIPHVGASGQGADARGREERAGLSFADLQREPALFAGRRLGPYTVVRVLASGGGGIAYLGRNERTGQRVTIKVSLPVLSDIEALRLAVSRGVRGLVALDHPDIVRVHEFDGLRLDDATTFYVVLDYVEGVTLDVWADRLTDDVEGARAFLHMAYRIALALHAAHTCRYPGDGGFETVGVLHGDVKPGNIMVRTDGSPALLDFMLVDVQREIDPAFRRPILETDAITLVFGTPGFMAPEQEQDGVVTVRSDVYGLGATLFAISTPAQRAPVGELLARMLGPVDARPATMEEVAQAIAEVALANGLASPDMAEYVTRGSRGPAASATAPRGGMLSALKRWLGR